MAASVRGWLKKRKAKNVILVRAPSPSRAVAPARKAAMSAARSGRRRYEEG